MTKQRECHSQLTASRTINWGCFHRTNFYTCWKQKQILARLLAESASDSKLFECLASLSIISNNISKELKDTLDARITNAFEFLDLSPSWSLFGENGIENYQSRDGKLVHLNPKHQHVYSPHYTPYIFYGDNEENLLNNRDLCLLVDHFLSFSQPLYLIEHCYYKEKLSTH